jgi:predicted RNA binding protein YcfA (HicA-like mRNA interferase family)
MTRISRDYLELAKQHGFVLVRCNKHAVFRHQDGSILTCPSSPSDSRRGLLNLKRDIRRALARNNSVLQPGDRT